MAKAKAKPRTSQVDESRPTEVQPAKLRPRFTSETRYEYVNHMVIGSTGLDSTLAFGQLAPFSGMRGLVPQTPDQRGSFDVLIALSVPQPFLPALATALLQHLLAIEEKFPIESLCEAVRQQHAAKTPSTPRD